MKIGLEMRYVALGPAGGIAQHMRGVLRTLMLRHPQHEYVVFHTLFNLDLLAPVPERVEMVPLPLRTYFRDLDAHARAHRLDVLFRAYPVEPHIRFPLKRQVVHIPDIQHVHHPEFFTDFVLARRKAAFDPVLTSAGSIGTPSEFSRQAILDQPECRCRDLFLMPPALQAELRGPTEHPRETPYFLFPANVWAHKNHRRLLEAFRRFRQHSHAPVELVCTGHPDGWAALGAEQYGLGVRHLGFVPPAELRRLLQGARALVFFSLYEGFGMPLLEAFAAGTPVLCGNTTSLLETGGDAVLSCDPTDPAAMAALMARIHADEDLRAQLAERGRARLARYSWERSADALLAACERVAAHSFSVPQHLENFSRRILDRLRPPRSAGELRTTRVQGLWTDNRLASRCTIRLPDSKTGQLLWLTGEASQPSQLQVSCGNEQLADFKLSVGTREHLSFETPSGQGQELVLEFSGPPRGFHLLGTNLFSEVDLQS